MIKFVIAMMLLVATNLANALALDNHARLWTDNGNEVPVCFSEGFNSWSDTKRFIVDLLRRTWEANANITFTDFDTCNGANDQARVRVLVKRWDNDAWYGKTFNAPGMASLRAGPLPECYRRAPGDQDGCVWSVIIFAPKNATGSLSSSDKQSLSYYVVHEFGHVLGFAHDQDSDRNFNFERELSVPERIQLRPSTEKFCRPASKPGIPDHRVITDGFDTASIMVQGYCEGGWRRSEEDPWSAGPAMASGRLSPLDVVGVQLIYGKPPLLRRSTQKPAPGRVNARSAPLPR
jgi:hypothetical protein